MMFNEILRLQNELDNLFGHDMFPFSTFARGTFPAINLFEKDDVLTLKAELPCVQKENIKINLEGDMLSFSGERKNDDSEGVNFHRRERKTGTFSRKIKLPYRVDAEKVSAELTNGILTINMEKDETEKPRTISVR